MTFLIFAILFLLVGLVGVGQGVPIAAVGIVLGAAVLVGIAATVLGRRRGAFTYELGRLVVAARARAEVGVLAELQEVAAHVIAQLAEDEPELFRGDDTGPAWNRFQTQYQKRLTELGIRPTEEQRKYVGLQALRALNRAVKSSPPSDPPPTPVDRTPVVVGGGAS